MSARNLDQERAEFAWKRTAPSAVEVKDYKDFANLAASAPALVMSNGLMQTLAFYQHKKHLALLDAITSWIGPKVLGTSEEFEGVMKALHGGSSDTYMRATEEALEILKWIRQFAKARAEA